MTTDVGDIRSLRAIIRGFRANLRKPALWEGATTPPKAHDCAEESLNYSGSLEITLESYIFCNA